MKKKAAPRTDVPPLPARRDYKNLPKGTLFTSLPFMGWRKEDEPKKTKNCINHWRIPPVGDYGRACAIGYLYGAHFAQWLIDNPRVVGSSVLAEIAMSIDFGEESNTKGIWVGFFCQLERLIVAGTQISNFWEDANREAARAIGGRRS
jgi:hypothetical protein